MDMRIRDKLKNVEMTVVMKNKLKKNSHFHVPPLQYI